MDLVPLSVPALEALVAGDLEAASRQTGVPLTPYLVEEGWLWRIRLDQIARDPLLLDWMARVAVDPASGTVVGHVGFHGPPDDAGMVEVAYSVDPAHRRQGWATALLRTALEWAESEPSVRIVRASISPDNAASLATLRPFEFRYAGEQWDDEDGRELLFERPVGRGRVLQMRLVVETADYDDAVSFYRDVLGAPVELQVHGDQGEKVTILDVGRATLELSNPAQVEMIDRVEVGRRVAPRLRVAFEVAEVARVTGELVDAGAELVAEPTRTPWDSLNARLQAPAGLQLTLFEELGSATP